jgi:hypothetical protein
LLTVQSAKLKAQLLLQSAALRAKPTRTDMEALCEEMDQLKAALAAARAEVRLVYITKR